MKSIIEYAETVLDDFDAKEFCAVDALILSQFSYINLENMVTGLDQKSFLLPSNTPNHVFLKDLFKAEHFKDMFKGLFFPENNKKLLFALAASPRFRNIKLSYYTSKLDYEEEKQFSATTFSLPDQTTFIAYRGTDMNLISWKEDLNMAFKIPIPSQEEGVNYLNAIGKKVKGPLRVGGHSKGGNIAVYSATYCYPKIQDRIIDVYSFDGPGFKETLFLKQEFVNVKDKITKILPQSSVIGMLLQDQESYRVISSSHWGIVQHDPFTWVIDGGDFNYLKNLSHRSLNMNKVLNQWLNALSDKEREHYVDTLYHAIKALDVSVISDFSDIQISEVTSILKSFKNIDAETRKVLSTTIRELIILYVRNINSQNRKKNDNNE